MTGCYLFITFFIYLKLNILECYDIHRQETPSQDPAILMLGIAAHDVDITGDSMLLMSGNDIVFIYGPSARCYGTATHRTTLHCNTPHHTTPTINT